MSVEISAENRQEYQAWTPVEEDLEGLPKNIHDLILQMRVDCSTTDRNRMPYYGADDDIDKFTNIPYIDDGTRAHQLDIYIPHDAIMLAVHNLPVYIDVHGGGFVYGYKELQPQLLHRIGPTRIRGYLHQLSRLPTSRFPRTIAGRERGHRLVAESCG